MWKEKENDSDVVSGAMNSGDTSMSESSKGDSCGGRGEDDVRSDSGRRKGNGSGRRTSNGSAGENAQQSIRIFLSKVPQLSEGIVPVIPVGINDGKKGGNGGDHETLIVSSGVSGDHIMGERTQTARVVATVVIITN